FSGRRRHTIWVSDGSSDVCSSDLFYPPYFQYAVGIRPDEIERTMDQGRFMFIVVIPPQFEADLLAGRNPDIQVNIDATAMQQARSEERRVGKEGRARRWRHV